MSSLICELCTAHNGPDLLLLLRSGPLPFQEPRGANAYDCAFAVLNLLASPGDINLLDAGRLVQRECQPLQCA